ncbi:TPA: hypothetical protein DEP34_01260 [Candidatus Uhrbacteria bacterium]|uniref:Uncharacterized protein n=2 Tax=Candidatus Uhriibacteriota TaxID=1752732 RepID=A0A0G1T525_9BACT|nr:MAG: hypothetical protein UX45_C0015G0024 [Candidatus Uhrbacteria bacterium GW2011_GWF2_46_218]KKU40515.1 MAG: hypothetical protein UX57_C0015G0002 [Candidatus Uhrbacteria bacterium GW2011_GWE2_46_68]HBK33606.1 hypothetical protein [Candidatus Uhrbacteria bacterium]HCB19000.1 hypothetical protein [Candidatus Uhrbacteria bacterium]
MKFFHPSPESIPSAILGEAVLSSVSDVRDSLPEQHRAHFETLRQEIIDFAQAHNIPREALAKPDLLREAASKLPTPDLERLANLLERFEYLLKNKEPWKEKLPEHLQDIERLYHLREQYTSQVALLEQVGILKEGTILGIDNKKYPIPTLEQIASRLFERREMLHTKHDQGFTKLLLVPFGMSLDTLINTLKQFLLSYNQSHPSFNLDTDNPLYTWSGYQGADIGDSPKLVYYPQSFTKEGHGGKTKARILEEQDNNPDFFPGWTIHLLQPSNLNTQDTETLKGFAPIPRKGQGTSQGDLTPRPPLESGQSSIEYLSILQKAKGDEDSPYHHESGLTPEDWIIAFMIHLTETGKFLDNWQNNTESISYLTGAFFSSSTSVPFAYWDRVRRRVRLFRFDPRNRGGYVGVRFSVVV